MKKIPVSVLALLMSIFGSHGYGQSTPKAPDFSLKTSDGKPVQLSSLKGKVVLVNFWATWCGPCKSEIPGFLDLYEKYKDKGFEIIGISLDQEGWNAVTPFVKKNNIRYPVVLGSEEIIEAYGGINAIPSTFVVDKNGNIADHHVGYLNRQTLEKKLKELL